VWFLQALRRPTDSFCYLNGLLGKRCYHDTADAEAPCDSAAVQIARQTYLPYTYKAMAHGSLGIQRNASLVMSVEEIQGMIFGHIKACSTSFNGAEVKDAVITVRL
jgi:molecular chaperone DnaK (HSP70)